MRHRAGDRTGALGVDHLDARVFQHGAEEAGEAACGPGAPAAPSCVDAGAVDGMVGAPPEAGAVVAGATAAGAAGAGASQSNVSEFSRRCSPRGPLTQVQ